MKRADEARWLAAAARLGARGWPLSAPNPAVGAIIVRQGKIVGRGWTQAGGRPHAEAVALEAAGEAATGATLYVSLEPCAHDSPRGPSCTELIVAAKPVRVVAALTDPDGRTAGQGLARIAQAGITTELIPCPEAEHQLAGYLMQRGKGRPLVTLKLAMSLDGHIALADGTSQWITGEQARSHVHSRRAQSDAILVGGGTWRADRPRLDVRLPGLENRSPRHILLTRGIAPDGVKALDSPEAITTLDDTQHLYIEGGAGAAGAFLRADLVDRLHIYRAPILIGSGVPAIGDLGLTDLSAAHDRWAQTETRQLGSDTFTAYRRTRQSE